MQLFKRENYLKKIRSFYSDPEIIKVITGVRRCGKSCLMETIREELLADGVPEEDIIFLDLDSRKYRKIKTDDQLEELIDSFIQAEKPAQAENPAQTENPAQKEKLVQTDRPAPAAGNITQADHFSQTYGMKYLFIDEIQNVSGFEEVVNAFREDGGFSIFITGSNSYLLSGELVTKLTGRYIEFELYPLSFEEYLEMKSFYGKSVNPNLNIELNQYLLEGGFPKTVQYDNLADKRTYVKAVIDEIFEKDIRNRVRVRKKEIFEKIRSFVINNYGATTSISSMMDTLKKDGLEIKRETLNRYISALCDAKILYECPRFDMKSKKSLRGEKKYYLADTSFYFASNTDNRINFGPALENIVYIYARSRDYSVSVGRIGRLECDFILRDRDLDYAYVQVAYTINESRATEEREYAPLEQIRDNYPKYVMTADYLLQKRNGIRHVNLMEFMRNGEEF